MNQENILSAAKNAKSVEELKQIAVDNGIPLTDEKANFYFSLLEEKEGELTPEELEAATGGIGLVELPLSHCSGWVCKKCGDRWQRTSDTACRNDGAYMNCHTCVHNEPSKGLSASDCAHFADDGYGRC